MWIANNWSDYAVLDCGGGEKVERWGKQILVRPDPQAIWPKIETESAWKRANAVYHRSKSGGGQWEIRKLPAQWTISYQELTFNLKPMSFKHTGLFPEQAANWDFIMEKVRGAGRPVSVLNLFAYTGGATLAAAAAGANVCHVDASKGMTQWARENAASSGLADKPIRWIVDDCKKFVQREIRRGHKYDAIIMDPPSYGRGPSGETWKIEEDVADFVKLTMELLSDHPLFVLISSYSTGLAPSVMAYLLGITAQAQHDGYIEAQELGLPVQSTGLVLPCGSSARFIAR
ncbi:MAG: class I SAM-dependent methyltransferase [Butyricicoccus pullicaecorum]|nr:class I SAM-dependent methyltransferase [Butyricicoccus pullicaecorum]